MSTLPEIAPEAAGGLPRPGTRSRRRSGVLHRTVLLGLAVVAWWLGGCGRTGADRGEVIVYAAQDQVYAEPRFREFEQRTGIRVRAVYDSEAVKTVGLANRLLSERNHPRCDLFWGNEELRTRQLAKAGVWREEDGWRAFGHRSRRLVINTNLVSPGEAPRSLLDLTNVAWRGKVALAYPMFGTTVTHFLALRQAWGEAGWLAWCGALAANRPFLVDGNSVAARLVARGEAAVGLTDSDDIAAEQQHGAPLLALPLGADSLLIPNTIGLVRGAPHAKAADALAGFLIEREQVARLVTAGALEATEWPPRAGAGLRPDWGMVLADLEAATEQLRKVFLR